MTALAHMPLAYTDPAKAKRLAALCFWHDTELAAVVRIIARHDLQYAAPYRMSARSWDNYGETLYLIGLVDDAPCWVMNEHYVTLTPLAFLLLNQFGLD